MCESKLFLSSQTEREVHTVYRLICLPLNDCFLVHLHLNAWICVKLERAQGNTFAFSFLLVAMAF